MISSIDSFEEAFGDQRSFHYLDDEPYGPGEATGDDEDGAETHSLVIGAGLAGRHPLGVSPVEGGLPHLGEAASVERHQHGATHTENRSHHLGLTGHRSDPHRFHPAIESANAHDV